MKRPLAAEDTHDGAMVRDIIEESLTDNEMIHPGVKRTIRDWIAWKDAENARLDREINALRVERRALTERNTDLHAEIDAGVQTLTGASGTGFPVGTLVETGEHYKARVKELEKQLEEDRQLRERIG